jgi:fatty-acyl-CoA synthase
LKNFYTPIRKRSLRFGIPDEKYGEQVCVWIQMHDKSELTALEIKEYCKIAHYTIPGQVNLSMNFQ